MTLQARQLGEWDPNEGIGYDETGEDTGYYDWPGEAGAGEPEPDFWGDDLAVGGEGWLKPEDQTKDTSWFDGWGGSEGGKSDGGGSLDWLGKTLTALFGGAAAVGVAAVKDEGPGKTTTTPGVVGGGQKTGGGAAGPSWFDKNKSLVIAGGLGVAALGLVFAFKR